MSAAYKNSLQQHKYVSELNWITKFDILWYEFPKKLIQVCEKGEKPDSMLVREITKSFDLFAPQSFLMYCT